jgi:hypothetical protein
MPRCAEYADAWPQPCALSPNFKQQLYDRMVAQHRQEVDQTRREARQRGPDALPPETAKLAYTLQGGQSVFGTPVGKGQRTVVRTHPYAGTFAMYDSLTSEYERGQLAGRLERLQDKLSQVAPHDFVVRSLPPAPKGAPSFCEFTYTAEPSMVRGRM